MPCHFQRNFRMAYTLTALATVSFTRLGQSAPTGVAFHTATIGNDAWSGKLAAPNKTRTDGPFHTLQRARDAARQERTDGAAPVRIVIHGGTYYLADTLTLDARDCGLTIEAAPGEKATLSGGRAVTGWRPYRGKVLQADLSALELPDLNFRELYCDGKLMPWARVPNFDPQHPRTGGFLQNAGIVEKETKTKFRYREGELHPEKWTHPERAWMMFHDSLSYETQYCPVKSIDPHKRVIEASQGVYLLSVGNPFYVCGLLEELDAPGEWCVDPDTRTLYWWPLLPDLKSQIANPKPKIPNVVVPALTSAFVVKGDPLNDQWLKNVRIGHLAIRDCRGRAIQMTGARNCTVTACDLRNAEVGVYLGDDTHDCKVVGCDITQTQGDGVSIIGSSKDYDRVTGNVVDNCYIWDLGWGRIHNRCGGVYMHRIMRCKVTHNHIHDTPRYAIGMDVGGECEIAWNHCHHSNLVTLDTSIIEAATAMDWGLPMEEQMERNRKWNWNNSIHHNLLHDSGGWGTNAMGQLEAPLYSWGIYLDTHSSGWRVHDNVIYNTVLGAYMVNGGMENVFENNLCVDGREHQAYLSVWPKYVTTGNRVERNIFAYSGKSANLYTVGKTDKEGYAFRSNLVWANGEKPNVGGIAGVPRKGKDAWEGWLKFGQDEGSLIADPQFVNAAKRDYRLKPSSPAIKLGFKPIDLSKVGNYASPDRRTWPRPEVKVARDAMDYAPGATVDKPQTPLRDYEEYAVGESERNAHVGNKGEGTALVTDETAASGNHSLKFTDAAGLGQNFFPYITYPLAQESGSLKMTFDLRWETGALFALDWRDDPYYYNMGPNLTTTADGWLVANGKRMLQLPVGQWVHIETNCLLGEKATGKYGLTIGLPNAAPQVFKDTGCSPKFQTLNCVVFMSVAEGPTVFYVDNVEFKPIGGEKK
ncbi:MAG: right-handed parallel beta-helix repeat-containing protein [Armatimonadetes bacterium]|nr:right-handed parallel beta-helix repeat-containing protein [Armatimonadota bacterium]